MALITDLQANRKALVMLRPDYDPVSAAQLAALGTFLQGFKDAGGTADVMLWPEPARQMTSTQYLAMIAYYGGAVRSRFPLVYGGTASANAGAGDLATFTAYFPGASAADKVSAAYYCAAWSAGIRLDGYAAVADAAGLPFGLHACGISGDDDPDAGTGYGIYVAQAFADRFHAGYRADVLWEQEQPYTITGSSYAISLYDGIWDAVTLGISPAIEPPPPPEPPPPGLPPSVIRADWAWVLGPPQPAGGHWIALTKATGQRLSVRTGPGDSDEATFTIRSEDPAQPYVQELVSDLQVWRGGDILFTGRIIPTDDQLADSHQTTVTARDYRAVLRRRRPGKTTFTAAKQTDIAWNLITATQAQDGGWLGIKRAAPTPGGDTPRTISFDDSQYVADMIDQMAAMDAGFDWDIESAGVQGLTFRAWYPQRTRDTGVVLEYGSTLVRSITRSVDPGEYANSLYATGDNGATVITREAADLATRPEGRWDTVTGTTIKATSGAALASWATATLASLQVVIPSYVITLAGGAWDGPGHIWKGDQVRLRIRSGRLDVDAPYRVLAIDIDPTTPGREVVSVTVARLPGDLRRQIPAIYRRLRDLELR